jgi:hypothetical protein
VVQHGDQGAQDLHLDIESVGMQSISQHDQHISEDAHVVDLVERISQLDIRVYFLNEARLP